jgi:hypothetical protein
MSLTLDAIWSLPDRSGSHSVAEALQFVARRGGSHHTRHFFFSFGHGGGAAAFLLVPILLVIAFGGYLLRHPDKARGLKERLTSAWKGAAANPDRNRGLTAPPPNRPSAPYTPPHTAGGGMTRFNPPPGWPVPPGWTPTPDWKPDPSWAPAPPGWQFWLPAHPPPRPRVGSNVSDALRQPAARWFVAAAVIAVLVLVVVLAFQLFGGESTTSATGKAPSATDGASINGYGSLRIGMTEAEATSVMGSAPKHHFFNCTVIGENTLGALKVWIADSSGRVTGIETPAGTKTDRGVGDGSTPAEVRAAYSGPEYTIDEGNVGGQGMSAINVFEGPKEYTSHRLLSFLVDADGRTGPPSIGRPKGWEGC